MRCWKCFAGGAALSVALLVCQSRSSAADRPSDQAAPGKQQPQEMERTIKVTFRYLLYLPKDYEQRKSCPLMLFLHGRSERGDNLELLKRHGPPKLIAAGKDFPFIVVSPQCSTGRWEPVKLAVLLDEIVGRYKVDQDHIYVTGLSMGGFGTWALAAYEPDRFAALAPICGSADPFGAKEIAHIPEWVFHGGKRPDRAAGRFAEDGRGPEETRLQRHVHGLPQRRA